MVSINIKKESHKHHNFIVLIFTVVFILVVTGCEPLSPAKAPYPTNSFSPEDITAASLTPTLEGATATSTNRPSPTNTPEPLEPALVLLSDRSEGVIAYTLSKGSNADIYVMNVDGSGQTQLTDDPAYDAWPSWSPDGSQIAFMSKRSGNPDIFVMDADGSNLRQLTEHPANDIWPEWSPDGTRIAFPSRRDGNFEIYVMNPDGTDQERLTHTPGHEDFPTWSPDGTRILFTRSEIGEGTYVMNADGSGEKKLLDFIVLEPDWSPDGNQIVFGSDHGGFREIYVMDADGGNLQKLSTSHAGENGPAWAPDGLRIAFTSWRSGDGEIYLMAMNGNYLEQLTNDRDEEEFPAWQPASVLQNSEAETIEPRTITFGSEYNDKAFDLLVTSDGDTLIAGLTENTGLSHRITPGKALLVRIDPQGSVLWKREFGGDKDAQFRSIIQSGENEYVLFGEIAGSYTRNETDLYLVKVDEDGNEIWSQTFGGQGMDLGMMVQSTVDGGYILVGDQADEFPTDSVYENNIYLAKTDAEGNLIWSHTYGEKILYLGWGVVQTPDGGFVLAGWEARTIDDRDVILIKVNGSGEVEWTRTWDLGERDGAFDLILTADGHIVLACIQSMGSGAPSAVLIKADLDGNELWTKLIDEEGVGNTFWDILEDQEGGYLAVGDTHLGRVPGSYEDIHGAWVVKTDPQGEILWQYIFGRGGYDQAHLYAASMFPDGGYVLVGDVTGSDEKYSDILWMRLEGE